MNDCIFCKIAAGEVPAHKVYEDEQAIAFLDIEGWTKGHTLIVPKSHYENMLAVPDELLAKIVVLAKDLATNYKPILGCEGFYFLVAGVDVNHFHQHLIPRYSDDDLSFEPKHKTGDVDLERLSSDLRGE